MPSYSPPAPAPPYLAPSTDATNTVQLGTKAAPMLVVPGVGQVVRVDPTGKQLLLDAQAAEPAQSLCHFHPGPLPTVATQLRTFRNNRTVKNALATLIEVQMKTPPSGSASGYVGLTIAGAAGGSQNFTLNNDGAAWMYSDLQAPVNLGSRQDSSQSGFLAYSGALASSFVVSSDQTVTGVQLTIGQAQAAARRQVGILDANGKWLCSTIVASSLAAGHLTVLLPVSIPCKAGTVYFVAMRNLDGGTIGWDRALGVAGAVNYPPAGYGVPFMDTATAGNSSIGWSAPWSRPVNETGNGIWGYDIRDSGLHYGRGGDNGDVPAFALLGKSAGVLLSGDITVTTYLSGTAPATPPADVNLRLELANG